MGGKEALRASARARRDTLSDRETKSRLILDKVMGLRSYREARVVSSYVGIGSEVATLPLIAAALGAGKTVAVPWVDGADIHLTSIAHPGELEPAGFGLLEPPPHIREIPDRMVAPSRCALVLVPGLAFDRRGYRLGYGRGYYDRLLSRMDQKTVRIGLAFEGQLVERVPDESHDQRLHLIVTERGIVPIA